MENVSLIMDGVVHPDGVLQCFDGVVDSVCCANNIHYQPCHRNTVKHCPVSRHRPLVERSPF
jgi:hypothetical protein